jgi:hypothetical protein
LRGRNVPPRRQHREDLWDFLEQVKLLLPLDPLSVLLIDPDKAPSRIAFYWESPTARETPYTVIPELPPSPETAESQVLATAGHE